jgi:hypothetical protein
MGLLHLQTGHAEHNRGLAERDYQGRNLSRSLTKQRWISSVCPFHSINPPAVHL